MTSMVPEIKKDVTPKHYIRKDVWAKGGTFADDTLYWYAKGVQALKAKPITDPTSWWFFAGMHGFDSKLWEVYLPEQNKNENLPSSQATALYWNQCQHGTWHFLPWHRGYLLAIEYALKMEISKLGGPNDWALPYIDYMKDQRLPDAFTQTHFKNRQGLSEPNPLYMQHRYPILDTWLNIDFNKLKELLANLKTSDINPEEKNFDIKVIAEVEKINVVTRDGEPLDKSQIARLIQGLKFLISTRNTELCEKLLKYLEEHKKQNHIKKVLRISKYTSTEPPFGFGGPVSDFTHSTWQHGVSESMPHDLVHILIGGYENHDINGMTSFGAMSIPESAGLDPIFYLHHANIDRLWSSWVSLHNKTADYDYSLGQNNLYNSWNEGPKEGKFIMPLVSENGLNSYFEFTPQQVQNNDKIKLTDSYNNSINYSYEYDELISVHDKNLEKTIMDSYGDQNTYIEKSESLSSKLKTTLLGATKKQVSNASSSDKSLKLSINLAPSIKSNMSELLSTFGSNDIKDNDVNSSLVLSLEGINSKGLANMLIVTDEDNNIIGVRGLFGLKTASDVEEEHGGNGKTAFFELNRSELNSKSEFNFKVTPLFPTKESLEIQQASIRLVKKS